MKTSIITTTTALLPALLVLAGASSQRALLLDANVVIAFDARLTGLQLILDNAPSLLKLEADISNLEMILQDWFDAYFNAGDNAEEHGYDIRRMETEITIVTQLLTGNQNTIVLDQHMQYNATGDNYDPLELLALPYTFSSDELYRRLNEYSAALFQDVSIPIDAPVTSEVSLLTSRPVDSSGSSSTVSSSVQQESVHDPTDGNSNTSHAPVCTRSTALGTMAMAVVLLVLYSS